MNNLQKWIVLLVLALMLVIPNSVFKTVLCLAYFLYLIVENYRDGAAAYSKHLNLALYCVLIFVLLFQHVQHYEIYLIAIFMVLLGVLVEHLDYNAFIGIRIPSTWNSEKNWRKTHHLMAVLSIPFALCLLILSQFINPETAILATTVSWLAISILYSIYEYTYEIN